MAKILVVMLLLCTALAGMVESQVGPGGPGGAPGGAPGGPGGAPGGAPGGPGGTGGVPVPLTTCALPGQITQLGAIMRALGISLNGMPQATVFAPTNQAWAAAFTQLRISPDSSSWTASQRMVLKGIVYYHVVEADVRSTTILSANRDLQSVTLFAKLNTTICADAINTITLRNVRGRVGVLDAAGNVAITPASGSVLSSCLRTGRQTRVHFLDSVLSPCPGRICTQTVLDVLTGLNRANPTYLMAEPIIRTLSSQGENLRTKSVFVPLARPPYRRTVDSDRNLDDLIMVLRQSRGTPMAVYNEVVKLQDVFQYHITTAAVTAANVSAATLYNPARPSFCTVPTTNTLRFSPDFDSVWTSSGQSVGVVETYQACDGNLYVVEDWLMPCTDANSIISPLTQCRAPATELLALANGALANSSNVLRLMVQLDLIPTTTRYVTIFAPPDNVLADLDIPIDPAQRTPSENLVLREVLRYHIVTDYVPSVRFSDNVTDVLTLDTALQNTDFCPGATSWLQISTLDDGVFEASTAYNDLLITGRDISTLCLDDFYMVVHTIDSMLIPCPDISLAFDIPAPPSPPPPSPPFAPALPCGSVVGELQNLARSRLAGTATVINAMINFNIINAGMRDVTLFLPEQGDLSRQFLSVGIQWFAPQTWTPTMQDLIAQVLRYHVVTGYNPSYMFQEGLQTWQTRFTDLNFCPNASITLRTSTPPPPIRSIAVLSPGSRANVQDADVYTLCLLEYRVVIHYIQQAMIPCPSLRLALPAPAARPGGAPGGGPGGAPGGGPGGAPGGGLGGAPGAPGGGPGGAPGGAPGGPRGGLRQPGIPIITGPAGPGQQGIPGAAAGGQGSTAGGLPFQG